MTGPTPSFLDRPPVPLAFGTSGLRGLASDITDLEAYIQVKGAIRHLIDLRDIRPGSAVSLAGDLRPSTDRILGACARAIVDCHCEVENCGPIPTPALIAHAIAGGRASVMVTGSHIPFDRNGIKLGKSGGEILKSDEEPIGHQVARVRIEEYSRSAATSLFDRSGELKQPTALPEIDGAAVDRYVGRYLNAFPAGGLRGLRVVVYQHSAVGRDLLVNILRELGAEVIAAGRSDAFVPIDTENITDEQLARIEALAVAVEADAGPLDAVVSTDGDSDRPLVLGVMPAGTAGRRLRFLPGDLLGIVVAEYLRADAVVVPISANDAVDGRMQEIGTALRKSRIGSPHVIAAMDELRRTGAHRRIAGWEANGGFLTASPFMLNAGVLTALPTRDAVLPIVVNLLSAVEHRLRLSALWSRLPARFGRSGLLDHVPVEVGLALLERLIPPGKTTEIAVDQHGGMLDDSGGGRPIPLSDLDERAWWESLTLLGRVFTPALGFPPIIRLNVLDGVRVHFRNRDVAHVRPSGNAPQLRIYANSDTQARADRIVELGLGEPDGILRQLVSGLGPSAR